MRNSGFKYSDNIKHSYGLKGRNFVHQKAKIKLDIEYRLSDKK